MFFYNYDILIAETFSKKEIFMKYFVCFLILSAVFSMQAKTIPFRSGEILAAEFSRTRPAIQNWSKHLFSPDNANYYAAVTVRIAPGRKISIYDYALAIKGVNFPCVALRSGSGKFEYTPKALSADKEKVYTMLFFVRDTTLSGSMVRADLLSLLPPATHNPVSFNMTNRNSGAFTVPSAIKKDGNF